MNDMPTILAAAKRGLFNEASVKRGEGGKFANKRLGKVEMTQRDGTSAVGPRNGAPRIEEDEVPMKSKGGAKLVNFDGKGSGYAVYADGSVFDGRGWQNTAGKTPTKGKR